MTVTTGEQAIPLGHHFKRTFQLAAPIILARTALIVMFTVDTVMTGWAGADELAFFALGVAPQLSLMMIAIGALQATAVLAAQASGGGRGEQLGEVLRASLLHALVLGFVILLLSLLAGDFFLATGQSPFLAAGAARITFAFGLGLPGMLLFVAGNLFLEATGRPKVGMAIMLAANFANVPLNGILALGWGGFFAPMGAEGAMIASSILRTLAAVAIGVIIGRSGASNGHTGTLLDTLAWRSTLRDFGGETGRQLRRLGLPMGLAQGVESAAFAAVVMLAGLLGAAELAAYQTVMTLVTLTFMMAVGTSGAAAIRVGRAIGAGDSVNAGRAGWAAIGLGALLPIPVSFLFLAAPESIVSLITSDANVIDFAATALHVAAFMLSADAAMAVAIGALRGLGDVWIPTLLQVAAFWLVAVPCAWVFGLWFGLGSGGLIGGLMAGVFVSLAGLAWRFLVISNRKRALG